ncbi:MAG: hypothetical protein MUP16_09320 [Sedimentisphaerales bacterium]|nr:hypothetical protein [Sedimentisphaerales bacterium]
MAYATEKGIEHTLKKGFIYTTILFCVTPAILLCFCEAAGAAADANSKFLGDQSDGSRAIPVHLIPLVDEEGDKITPADEPFLPFSTRQTCSACHDYEKISRGWHFNAAEPNIVPGRQGQPWIFVDAGTATQIPLSYRTWPGAFRPEQFGLTSWKFVQLFGRQTPGGGVGEIDSNNPDEMTRGFISGKLEINCMSCHDADPAHNQAEYADQIARQNFRWAAAATCSFASVSGSARNMPSSYDPLMPEPLDDPKLVPPAVTYRKDAFDHRNQIFFNIVRKVPTERCYFCHSNQDINKDGLGKWATDEDVHLAAGLTCVDCHRNGLDHNITRGYESEASVSKNPLAAALSCESCHKDGRLGAPVPKHLSIPPVHFDTLTCTACHSGPWPDQKTLRTKTSRAHGLGPYNVNKSDDVLPHIIYPVFAKQPSGKIGPHKLIWPTFWGSLKGQKVTPIPLEVVRPIAGKIIDDKKLPPSGNWSTLTPGELEKVLELLKTTEGEAVYICGGKLYRLGDKGSLITAEHDAAKPYLWPIAHDVRPAAQSLGARRCEECHSTDASFFFGDVEVDTPIASEAGAVKKMIEFEGLNPVYTKLFAFSFIFRPFLKVVALCSSAILAAVLILYVFQGLARILNLLSGKNR